MVVVGGEDAWMATDILKNNNIPVVIKRTQALPSRADEDIDLPFKLPKLLQDAGVLYCITLGDGSDGFWDQRNLPFHAGQAVPNGLTQEQAITAITSNPAKILNISDKTGTLEAGKDANIIIISNEIGMGLHADTKIGRKFTELQGWVNQYIAKKANKATFMVSGLPLTLK